MGVKGCSAAFQAFKQYFPVVCLGNFVYNRQPQAGSFVFCRKKGVKDFTREFFFYPRSRIFYAYQDVPVIVVFRLCREHR